MTWNFHRDSKSEFISSVVCKYVCQTRQFRNRRTQPSLRGRCQQRQHIEHGCLSRTICADHHRQRAQRKTDVKQAPKTLNRELAKAYRGVLHRFFLAAGTNAATDQCTLMERPTLLVPQRLDRVDSTGPPGGQETSAGGYQGQDPQGGGGRPYVGGFDAE